MNLNIMRKFLLFALVITMFAACTTDETQDVTVELTSDTLAVSFENSDSRIQLNEEGKSIWNKGDILSVFYRSNANQQWQFQGNTGDRSGVIKRLSAPDYTQETSKIVVVYPYNQNYYLNPTTCNLQAFLPATQHYLKDSYGHDGNLMVSASEYKQFALKNVCGFLKLQFTGGNTKIKSITVSGNNGEQVAGEIYINTSDATAILASEIGGSSSDSEVGGTMVEENTILTEVTLDCGEGVALNQEASTSFYIALPPQTFENGVKVVMNTSDNRIIEKTTSNTVTIARNTILPLKSIEISDTEGDAVEVLRTHYEGADIRIRVPEHIKQQNRRVRWGVTNIAAVAYNGKQPIPSMLLNNDLVYPAFIIKNDTTLNINHHNAYRRNANGDIGYYVIDETSVREVSKDSEEVRQGIANVIQYYYLFQPGEPVVLMMSEVDYADGWYGFPYDYEGYLKASYNSVVDPNQFWYEGAWWREVKLTLPSPSEFAGSVGVNVSDLSTNGGTITFTPDDKTFVYLFGIFEDTDKYGSGFQDITNKYLDGKEELWQWFTTAEMAHYFGIQYAYASEGAVAIKLKEYFREVNAGATYHIVVNALPSKMVNGEMVPDASAQNYQHITFTLPSYTLPEPKLQVTAADAYSPWKVKFNVKNPEWQTNPISKVSFVANYAHDFASYMKANGFTYTDMAMMNAGITGYQLNDADIEMVNSPAGAEIEFDVRADSEFTAAFIAWNSEGRASNPDSTTYPGYAVARSTSEPSATPLDMTKLNALKGEWTATATVNTYNFDNGNYTTEQRSWKVTIGDLTSPETLSQDLYDFFERHGVSKEAADAYFSDFKTQETAYNQSVLGQNRVLCTGWAVDGDRVLSTATPWDLFIMEDYNSSATSYLYHDFGPKWFLQVNEKGDVFVPVNYNRIAPLTSWYNGQSHYLCGGNYEAGYAFPYYPFAGYEDSVEAAGLPVTISRDGNTVTVNGYTVNINNTLLELYPNIIFDNYGMLQFYHSYITSSVVLTRGWTGATSAPTRMSVKSNIVRDTKAAKMVNGVTYTTPSKPYAKTTLIPQQKRVEPKVLTIKQPTREEIDSKMKQYLNRGPIRK